MWYVFNEKRCRRAGWIDAYWSYFRHHGIDPKKPVRKTVGVNAYDDKYTDGYANFDVVSVEGKVLTAQRLRKEFYIPIPITPFNEEDYL